MTDSKIRLDCFRKRKVEKAKPIEQIDIKATDLLLKPEEEIPQGVELDLDQTDQLKKAIIYTEILGKPISLRD